MKRIVRSASAVGCLVGAGFCFAAATRPVVQVEGTVTEVVGGACRARYLDSTGTSHSLIYDGHRRWGCADEAGDPVDVYYRPGDPTDADISGPVEDGAFGAALVAGAGLVGVSARLDARRRRPAPQP